MRTIEEILAAQTAIINGAAGRSLTADEITAYETLESELVTVQASAAVLERHAAYNRVVVPAGVPRPGGPGAPDDGTAGLRNYLLTGRPNVDLNPSNAQAEGVPTQGGYIVPDIFRDKLVEKLKAFGGLANNVERYTTGNGAPVEWPTIDDTANLGEIVFENGSFSAGADLVFGTNALGAYSYATGGTGGPVKVPRELVQDAAFDIQALIARLFATRIYRIQAQHWVSGTGVAQPLGLTTGRTPIQSAANTGITYEDLVTYIHSVDPAYRDNNCKWAMNDLSLAELEKIKDGSGSYIYRGRDLNLQIGVNEATLLGYGIIVDQAFPTLVKTSPTVQWGAFGNFKQGYVVRDVKDVEILVNPYTSMANRQIEISGWARADGTQQDTNAYVTLTAHT